MTGASTQDGVSLAHNDCDATPGEIGTSWSRFTKQELSELKRNEELVDQVVVTHRPNTFASMYKPPVLNGGNVERFGRCDEVVACVVRPAAAQQQQQRPAVAAARHGGGHG